MYFLTIPAVSVELQEVYCLNRYEKTNIGFLMC